MPIEGDSSGDDNGYDEPPRRRPGEKPDLDISDINKTEDCQPIVQVDPSNLPTVQQDLYQRIQQHQQQPQQQDSQQNVSTAKKSSSYGWYNDLALLFGYVNTFDFCFALDTVLYKLSRKLTISMYALYLE